MLHIAGAAGGMGAALHAFCHAELRRGIEIVTEALGLAQQVQDADLVITGEGASTVSQRQSAGWRSAGGEAVQ